MYLGTLIWSSSNTPHNYSPFSFSEADPLRMEELKNCHLMLQLILIQEKRMTVDETKASNKQEVHTHMNFHGMAEQPKMFSIANNIFLGKLSVESQCLRSLQAMINQN
jgi:hypothetical protein